MQVNFWSLTRIAKTVMRGMIRARAGRIVAIGSVAALQGNPATPPMRRRRARSSPIAARSPSRPPSAASP
jgi:NAD(P)-dependent dehydrogenase (short-subunit alcohol dehydrogenase family)